MEFLIDAEGDPWTWVMGEHPEDKTIDQILEEEEREAARQLAEQEAQQLRWLKSEIGKSEFYIFTSNQRQTLFVDLNQFNLGGFSTISCKSL